MPVPTEVSASLAQTPPYRPPPPFHTATSSVTPLPPSTPSPIGHPAGVPPTAYTRQEGYFPPGPTVPMLRPDVSPGWGPYVTLPQLRLYPFYAPFSQSVPFTGAMLPFSYHGPQPPTLARWLKPSKAERKRLKAERKRLNAIQVETTRLQGVKDWLEKYNGAATDTDNEASEKAAASEKINVPAADIATAMAARAANVAARHAVATAIRADTVAYRAFATAVDAAGAAVAAADAALKAAADAVAAAAMRDMEKQNSEIVTKPADNDVNQSLEHTVEEMAAEQDGPRHELSDLHTEEDERSAA
ncbi:hypothetical protein HETIRDRAFT_456358 [Heterobasidion irregulare TC 32-1]|uniref:Uncharacterized protein n=1 Tax=Heterobasidion irregulare (strain TC 32-1) TaxID=747525 RepID=W4JPP2_HETIT|nr:uncharacterized protein HETIRDRAFT_456358 [Heterobasidion irregulare TC 32-1]ETW74836.1 hypothetical protein HETIRDRAFT_456358 [Heterobasidion irregulare TC 32-1]